MVRLLASAVVSLLADAVALVVAAQLLDDMALDAGGFATAVVLFALVGLLVEPLMRQVALRNAPALLGSTALVATLVSLIVTALVSDGLRITGFDTWVLATIIVWAVALVVSLLLPLVIFRSVLRRDERPGGDRSAPATG
jgi:putative membrane protein